MFKKEELYMFKKSFLVSLIIVGLEAHAGIKVNISDVRGCGDDVSYGNSICEKSGALQTVSHYQPLGRVQADSFTKPIVQYQTFLKLSLLPDLKSVKFSLHYNKIAGFKTCSGLYCEDQSVGYKILQEGPAEEFLAPIAGNIRKDFYVEATSLSQGKKYRIEFTFLKGTEVRNYFTHKLTVFEFDSGGVKRPLSNLSYLNMMPKTMIILNLTSKISSSKLNFSALNENKEFSKVYNWLPYKISSQYRYSADIRCEDQDATPLVNRDCHIILTHVAATKTMGSDTLFEFKRLTFDPYASPDNPSYEDVILFKSILGTGDNRMLISDDQNIKIECSRDPNYLLTVEKVEYSCSTQALVDLN